MSEKQFNKNDSDCYSAPNMEILCFQILWLRFRFTASRPSVNKTGNTTQTSRCVLNAPHTHTSCRDSSIHRSEETERKWSATILISVSVRFQLLKWENLLFFLRSCWVLDTKKEIQILELILWNLFQPKIRKVPVSGCSCCFPYMLETANHRHY